MVDTYSECSKSAYNNSHSESLLQKWNIPVSHLDFEYIKNCNNAKELERILRILRSGQEGHYPELTKCAEERLSAVNPKSRALLVNKPILNKFTCDAEEWNNICQDIQNWQEEVSIIDGDLQDSKNLKIKTNLPDVRKVNETEKPKNDKNDNDKPKVNRIKSWDYAAWDKYDPEVELVREQLEEEKLKKEKLKKEAQEKIKNVQKKKKSVCFDDTENLTETESLILSNREKDLGNECFKANDFEEAKKYYTNSIKLRPTAAAYNNRCIANIKLKKYKEALDDSAQVLRREPENTKALFRKAQAYNGLKDYTNAFETLDQLISIDPNNTSAQSLMNDVRNKVTDISPPQRQRLIIEEIDDDGNVINNDEKPISKTKKVVVPIPSTSKFQGPNIKIMEVTEPVKDTTKSYDFKNVTNNNPAKKLQIKPKSNISMSPKIVEIDTDSNSNINSSSQKKIEEIKSDCNLSVSSKIVEIDHDSNSDVNSITSKKIEEIKNYSNSIVSSKIVDINNDGNSNMKSPNIVEIDDALGAQNSIINDSLSIINTKISNLEIVESVKPKMSPSAVEKNTIVVGIENTPEKIDSANCNLGSEKLQMDINDNPENTEPYFENPKSLNTQPNGENLENVIPISQILPPQVEYYENNFDRGDYIHKKNFNPAIISGSNKPLDQENNLINSTTKLDDNTVMSKRIKIDKGGSGEPCNNEETDLIQTPYEFTRAWQGIKDRNDLISRAKVIRRIPPGNLLTVLGNKLDGPMFSSWLECLHLYFCTPSDVDIVEQFFNEIIHVPRFDIIAMFMNDSDKIAVSNLISFLNQHGRHLSDHVVQAFDAKF